MLVLFETAAGYALFKLLDDSKLKEAENVWKKFQSPDKASEILKLVTFKKFKDTTEALDAATSLLDGKFSKSLKKFLRKNVSSEHEKLAVGDVKLGNLIKEKFDVSCVNNSAVSELMRGIRSQFDSLIGEIPRKEFSAMSLGLAHSLSRYKLKFSPDKIDTMIVQAVSLLDDLDKELNNYIMRCREWYSWHFPELAKVIADHQAYAKVVRKMGIRSNAKNTDLSDILPEDLDKQVKEEAEISMGTEISELDMLNICELCDQIIEINSYRTQLYEYLKNRMTSLAPNVTALLGELVGARLISHAGSLMNLAKYPASTIQILGAEKALFRALKTKRDTPKYGLIYHAQLIGQAPPKLKGKMSRMLAAKAAIACRVDALGEEGGADLGIQHRAYLEKRISTLKDVATHQISGTGKARAKMEPYSFKSEVMSYDAAADSSIPKAQKRSLDQDEDEKPPKKKVKREVEEPEMENGEAEQPAAEEAEEAPEESKKKKKKKKKEKVKEDSD